MNKLAVIILSLLLSMTSAHSAEFAETDISEEMSTELQKNPSKKLKCLFSLPYHTKSSQCDFLS